MNWFVPEPKSSSVTVNETVYTPADVYVWLPVTVPEPFDSETIPF